MRLPPVRTFTQPRGPLLFSPDCPQPPGSTQAGSSPCSAGAEAEALASERTAAGGYPRLAKQAIRRGRQRANGCRPGIRLAEKASNQGSRQRANGCEPGIPARRERERSRMESMTVRMPNPASRSAKASLISSSGRRLVIIASARSRRTGSQSASKSGTSRSRWSFRGSSRSASSPGPRREPQKPGSPTDRQWAHRRGLWCPPSRRRDADLGQHRTPGGLRRIVGTDTGDRVGDRGDVVIGGIEHVGPRQAGRRVATGLDGIADDDPRNARNTRPAPPTGRCRRARARARWRPARPWRC